jgi:hypothetical protein
MFVTVFFRYIDMLIKTNWLSHALALLGEVGAGSS